MGFAKLSDEQVGSGRVSTDDSPLGYLEAHGQQILRVKIRQLHPSPRDELFEATGRFEVERRSQGEGRSAYNDAFSLACSSYSEKDARPVMVEVLLNILRSAPRASMLAFCGTGVGAGVGGTSSVICDSMFS